MSKQMKDKIDADYNFLPIMNLPDIPSFSIVIGRNLTPTHDYHLLVDVDDIKIDRTMTKEEYETIYSVIKALDLVGNKKNDNEKTE